MIAAPAINGFPQRKAKQRELVAVVYGHLFEDTAGDLDRMASIERDLLAA